MILGKTRIALSLVLLALSSPAIALPTGPTVGAGSATFTTSGGTLTIQNSNNTIINWQGFSIGASETTRFNQPSSSSAVLNRVVTASPSSIFGSLTSNGNVFLINPNGILFGAGSQVSVGGTTLSTSDIADANFLAGNYTFAGGGSANISLDGTIVASSGLTVSAIGGTVLGTGTLSANNIVINTGLVVGGGGVVTAGPITITPGGSLTLTGGGDATTGSTINASGGSGLAVAAAGSSVQLAGIAVSNKSPAFQGSGPSISAANPATSALTGIVAVTSVSMNLQKREVAF